ncbi:MAG: hypothetical protein JNL11_02565 [Bdellovibrionaceae bacterium]|nr:hypothetical protein [Pseudobdellovibrionaceae bacterium]
MAFQNLYKIGFLMSSLSIVAFAQKTDLQKILTPSNISREELIKNNHLIRLWPLDSVSSRGDKMIIENVVKNTAGVMDRGLGIVPVSCGGQSYARFHQGAILSDETMVIKDLLKNAEYNVVQRADDYLRKKAVAGVTWLSGQGSSVLDPYTQLHSNQLVKDMQNPEIQKAIANTTSLVKVTNENRHRRLQLENSDYTIGGWFKADPSPGGTSLFKKYFYSPDQAEPILEWEMFATGNDIFFHGHRDNELAAEMKYLSTEDARRFRAQHADFYGLDDTYDDLLEKKAIQDQMTQPKKGSMILQRIFVDMPIAHKSAKPVPPPNTPPPVSPPVQINPPFIPLPPNQEVPRPYYPQAPVLIGYVSSGKDHTIGFNIKQFWWGMANSLGACSDCIVPNRDHDIWHFFAVSVHFSDPLGPYLDLTIIRDPNEFKFGNKATLSTHFRTQRVFLNHVESSRPYKTPIAQGFKTEKGCRSHDFCTRSELEIGGINGARPFNGYMRGIFMSKKALNQSSILQMAAQFNPQDARLCSYNRSN